MQREIKVRAFGECLTITRCAGGWQTTDGRVFQLASDAARYSIETHVMGYGDEPTRWKHYINASVRSAAERAEAACC